MHVEPNQGTYGPFSGGKVGVLGFMGALLVHHEVFLSTRFFDRKTYRKKDYGSNMRTVYTTRHTIVHLCIPELETFHLTPSQHLLFFLSSEGPHLQTKPETDIWGKWHLL